MSKNKSKSNQKSIQRFWLDDNDFEVSNNSYYSCAGILQRCCLLMNCLEFMFELIWPWP